MRRLRCLVGGLPAESAYRRTLNAVATVRPVLAPPMRRGRTSAETIRKFGGRIIETREGTG